MNELSKQDKISILTLFGKECEFLARGNSEVLEMAYLKNNWFTEENVRFCLTNWSNALREEAVAGWVPDTPDGFQSKKVGIVMAGNIPLVGLHDLLSVLVCGHRAMVKLSRDDEPLMKWAIHKLILLEPGLTGYIEEVERVQGADMVIATGSNNTSRYFEYYFRNIPHIIRKNRTGIAVLTGEESRDELTALGEDIFRYFGLGCRNVSKIFVPKGYDFSEFYESLVPFSDLIHHNKYANNYTYHKAIFLMNGTKHLDNGLLILKEDTGLHAPLSCLFYSHYQQIDQMVDNLKGIEQEVQCTVCIANIPGSIKPGTTQRTELDTYADNINTLDFLLNN